MLRSKVRSPMSTTAAAVLLVLSLSATSAMATSALAPLSIDELTDLSDLVIEGRVVSIESSRENDRIFTYIEVEVGERLKGLSGRSATLKLYGGVYENTRTRVVGAPCMSTGEEVMLFLKANGTGTFDVVNLAEGKFEIVRDPTGPARVQRDLSDIAYTFPGDPASFPTDLEQLRVAVREARRR